MGKSRVTRTYKVLKDYVTPMSLTVMRAGDEVKIVDNEVDGAILSFYDALEENFFVERTDVVAPWRPKEGEEYEFITDDGFIGHAIETPVYGHDMRAHIGNKFKRFSGETEKAIEWLKAFKTLRDDARGFKPDWEDRDSVKWYVCYDYLNRILRPVSTGTCKAELIHFTTEADATRSIEDNEEAWKVFLGVEEGKEND